MTPHPELKLETKYIVCYTPWSGQDYAKKQGWSPKECVFIYTGSDAEAKPLRGVRIKPEDLYYAPGWWQGKHALEIERMLGFVVKQGQIKEKKEE